MKLLHVAVLVGALASAPAMAQSGLQGGPIELGPMDHNHAEIDAAHRASVSRARSLGLETGVTPSAAARKPDLEFPLRLRPQAKSFLPNGISNFVDLDASGGLKTFACTTRTYDGHQGIDFSLFPYAWRMMDGQEAEIVAAAPGVIVNKSDGQFDRRCDANVSQPANFVVVRQDNGLYAYYWHMKKGSVTTREVGARVATGDLLGLVGSSGRSSGPHLHFELRSAANFGGETIDAFAGACGATGTLWKHQPENVDTGVLKLATHKNAPPQAAACANPDPGYSDQFAKGAAVYGVVYLRDQRPDTPVTISFVKPDGTTFSSWTTNPIASVFSHSYWYGSITLPQTPTGRWTLRAVLENKTYEHAFMVGTQPAATTVQASVQPQARSVKTNTPAVFDVDVRNRGTRVAFGCSIAPDAPLAATWSVLEVSAAASETGHAFDLAAGATRKFKLTIRPRNGYTAIGTEVPIRVVCNNATAPVRTRGFNVLTLSFKATATVDVVASAKTPTPDNVLRIGGSSGTASFIATGKSATAGTITVKPSTSTTLPLSLLRICELTASNTCKAGLANSVTRALAANEQVKWRVTARASGAIALDIVKKRILVEFTDNTGVLRGATSVAVTTATTPASADEIEAEIAEAD